MATEITNFPRESTLREAVNALNMIAVAQASNMGSVESWETIKQMVRSINRTEDSLTKHGMVIDSMLKGDLAKMPPTASHQPTVL